MKKTSFIAVIISLLSFGACDNGSDYTYSEFGFYSTATDYNTIYADQEVDSFRIVSNKAWKALVVMGNEWMQLNPLQSSSSKNSTSSEMKTCPIYFNANTTNEIRDGVLGAESSDGKTIGQRYRQTYWLNISVPLVAFASPTSSEYSGAYFEQTMPKDSTQTTIQFTIYADEATLTTNNEWLQPAQTRFAKGKHTVKLTCKENSTGADRKAGLTLATSNNIKTNITIVQKGR